MIFHNLTSNLAKWDWIKIDSEKKSFVKFMKVGFIELSVVVLFNNNNSQFDK